MNPESVMAAIQSGGGCTLNFDAIGAGHSQCNRYAYGLVVNGKVYDFFSDAALVAEVMAKTADVECDRQDKRKTVWRMAGAILRQPALLPRIARRALEFAWRARRDLIAARGQIGKLSFFVHNFMDAAHLERKRCETCSFMVMTPMGPMSMCVHNAKRDDYLLVPAEVKREDQRMFWDPATGRLQEQKPDRIAVSLTPKNARGRARNRPLGGRAWASR